MSSAAIVIELYYMPGPVYYKLSLFICKTAISEVFPFGRVKKLKFREVKSNLPIRLCTH